MDSTNNVHITWEDYRDGNAEIYYTKLDSNGTTLVDDTRLTTDSADSSYPAIAVDNTNCIHITWEDLRDGNEEIYYKNNCGGAPPENQPPIVDFTYSPLQPILAETVTFNATASYDPDGNITGALAMETVPTQQNQRLHILTFQ
ncbi:MAG: hypothetical protein JW878_03490 [Methanomicrobia archaeon]|nr:hypothetical protein [Methanomicrobia archaeon]